MGHCHCCRNDDSQNEPRRRRSLVGILLQVAVLYVGLLFGGGTLKNTGHPVAVEAGRLVHTVLLVEPTISWVDHRGIRPLSRGLRVLSHGFPMHKFG